MDKKKEIDFKQPTGVKGGASDDLSLLPRNDGAGKAFDVYRNEVSGEAVGIAFGDLVFLKETSPQKLSWKEAQAYCETVVVNGITAELCSANRDWEKEFSHFSKDLYSALRRIGAEHPDSTTWCAEYVSEGTCWYAWYQNFCTGQISNGCKVDYKFYVRPVLRLKKL